MARVTVAELVTIYKNANAVSDATTLQELINTASLLVDEELTTVTPPLSVERLKKIELYLAAHFAVSVFEAGGIVRKKIDAVEEEYQEISSLVKGLQASRYGQMVILLDSTGRLGALSASTTRAQFAVVSQTE